MKKIFLSSLVGLTVLLGLGPFEFLLAGVFHSAILFYLSRKLKTHKEILKFSFIISFFITIFTFQWVVYSVYLLSGNFIYTIISFIIYVFISNLKIYFLFLILFFSKKRILIIFTFPILFFLTDRFVFQIFPWYYGNLIAGNIYLRQFASIAGVYGLSIIAGIFGVLINLIYIFIKTKKFKFKRVFLIYVSLIFLVISFGIHKVYFSKPETFKIVKIAMIQPATKRASIENKNDENFAKDSITDVFNLSLKSILVENFSLDIIAIPESAVPFHGTRIQSETEPKKVYSKTFHGVVQFLSKYSRATVVYNELDVLGKEKNLISSVIPTKKEKFSYTKRILLPFGEYLPFENYFPFLRELFPEAGNYSSGKYSLNLPYTKQLRTFPKKFDVNVLKQIEKPEILEQDLKSQEDFEERKFLGLICYEAMYSETVRESFQVKPEVNPDFILNLTNDSWFGEYLENYQHDSVVKLRAVEFGKAFVRPTLTGVSTAYNFLGEELVAPSQIGDKTYRILDVPIYYYITPYIILGDGLSYIFIFLLGVMGIRWRKIF